MGKQRYKQAEVLAALKACKGYIYLAAERLGCEGRTVLNYLKRYPKLREAIKHMRGSRLDMGEAALEKGVLAGEAWAVQFLLSKQGRGRGYGEQIEIILRKALKQAENMSDAELLKYLSGRGIIGPDLLGGSSSTGPSINGSNGSSGGNGAMPH